MLLEALFCLLAAAPVDTVATDTPVRAVEDGFEMRASARGAWFAPSDPATLRLDAESSASAAITTTGEALLERTGVHGVRRGAGQIEPVIRGMGSERVATQVGHLPLLGACPGRMDPPINFLPMLATDDLSIVQGLSSVTLGPGGTGGRIVLDDELRVHDDRDLDWGGWVRAGFDGARSARVGELRVDRRVGDIDLRVAGEALRADNYESANGTEVPAEQRAMHGSASAGWTPREDTRAWMSLNLGHEGRTLYPALPMDMDRSDMGVLTAGLRHALDPSRTLELRLGASFVDHTMDNDLKPNLAMMAAETESEAQTYGARVLYSLTPTKASRWQIGLDARSQWRDAVRTRAMTTGTTYNDHLWPEVRQNDVGAFAEYRHALSERWSLRVGARGERTSTSADATGDAALGGGTLEDAYARFYGEDARKVSDDEWTAAGNVQLSWRAREALDFYVGSGLSSRVAGILERTRAFAPAPGGFQLGNPLLSPEKGWENEIGVRWSSPRVFAKTAIHHRRVSDFVLSTTIDRLDVNGDTVIDRILGFENIDATIVGLEADVVVRPFDWLALPLGLDLVYGHNDTGDRNLPEIPPLEGRAALRFVGPRGHFAPWSAELGARFVARQGRVDLEFGEDESPGFITLRAGTELSLTSGAVLRVGVENLLDKEYHEHLTREAILPTGDLSRGAEVPAPGRYAHAAIGWRF